MTLVLGILGILAALLILLWGFLILPRVSGGADMELLRVNYAHRGLWNDRFPENSLSAFAMAARAGCGIELDIQLSKDRRVMVFHDGDLKRMCGVNKKVSELTCAELKQLRLLGTGETIPTLSEVLALINGRVPLMIEIKGERPDPALCVRTVRMLDAYNGPFCIESFSPLILRWFKHYRPSYARGQLVTKVTHHDRPGSRAVNFLLSHMLLNVLSRPDFISINGRFRKRPVFLLCTKVFHTPGFVWTVQTKKDLIGCQKQGLNGIFEKFLP